MPERNEAENKEIVRRGFWITKKDVIKYGPSTKCSGCSAEIRGGPRVQRSQECRERDLRCCSEMTETDEMKGELKEC